MKRLSIFLASLLFLSQYSRAQVNSNIKVNFRQLTNTHDILLSPWGPFSKKYAGISHIENVQSGLRFDFSVLPSIYGTTMLVPNVLMRSDYYPWKANRDLTHYTYRDELEWKDRTYVDVSYHVIDSQATLVEMRCVNNTALPLHMGLDFMAYIDYPENYSSSAIKSTKDVFWQNAVHYASLDFARPWPGNNLVNNGWLRGEIRDTGYIDGRAIGWNFGKNKGDRISYQLAINDDQKKGILALRFKMKPHASGTFRLSGLINQTITLSGTGDFDWKVIPYSLSANTPHIITLTSEGPSEMILNGLLIAPPDKAPSSYIVPQEKNWIPEKTLDRKSRSVILKYKDIPTYYGIAWDQQKFMLREVKNDELDVFFKKQVNDHVHTLFSGNGQGDYTDVCVGPFELDAHDEKTVYALICAGDHDQVKERLARLTTAKSNVLKSDRSTERPDSILPEGKKYTLSAQLMKATLMTNIVYPIYTQNSYIRHFTPGKWWNSIYTWDLGFIALGLDMINPNLAAECINAYTTPVGSQSAFILHGTPVPTQIYAFYDLWNETQSQRLLTYFYPRLRQYYEFLVGRLAGSTTRKFKSNILCTWDYFYNSGGWDDYPPQVAVHQQKVEHQVAPVITTAQCIRVAKMLRMAANYLHKDSDMAMYDQDIKTFSDALQEYSWNKTSGYFSYVVHNKEGYAIGHFKDSSGVDYNMGLGGAYPLLAGICTPDQKTELLDKIFSPAHMWTVAGISVVDQSAPYYRTDGYWNGTVWMPHQWFFWKTMLDLGRPDLAFMIAKKALDVYKRETDASYSSYEHFSTQTGRGGGWHQFSGLSSPILNWFTAYYKIGTVTPGFEIWINSQEFNEDHSSYKADISFDNATPAHSRSMVVCMNPDHRYLVTFGGKQITATSPYDGLIEITFPSTNKSGVLTIKSSDE